MRHGGPRASAMLLLRLLLLLLSSCCAAAGGGGGAAATIEALLTDLTAASVCHDLRDNATGAAIRQLDVVPLLRRRDGSTTSGGGGFVGVHASRDGVAVSTSADLRSFARTGTFRRAGGASAPALSRVTGRGPAGHEWWVLAFETTATHHQLAAAAAANAVAACDGYAVSGAGVAGVDGCYSKQRNVFVKDASHSIYPWASVWHIGTEGKSVFYTSLHPSASPPESTGGCGAVWAADKNHGAAPCPSVRRASSPSPAPAPPTPPQVTGSIGFALFTSEAALLAGNASRVFIAPNSPLLAAWGHSPVIPARYSSPTIYSAVYSQRGGQTTVDVVYGAAWTDGQNHSHPANMMLTALSPDASTQVSAPEHNAFFSFDGQGYDGTGDRASGPLHWERKLMAAVAPATFSYTGSASAYVPCGPGCGDPRDRAGGNADGLPGTVKLSLVAGRSVGHGDNARTASVLLLWGWDPIVKVKWLWPSGFGTAQGGFKNSAITLRLPGITLAPDSSPKIRVLPCPQPPTDGKQTQTMQKHGDNETLCLWVGLVATDGQLTFVKPLEVQMPAGEVGVADRFAPRFRTAMPPPGLSAVLEAHPSRLPPSTGQPNRAGILDKAPAWDAATRIGLTMTNDAFKLTVADTGAAFVLTELASGTTRTFATIFAVVSSASDPGLSDLKDKGASHATNSTHSVTSSLYFIADGVPSFWKRKQTLDVMNAGDAPTETLTASECVGLNSSAVALHFGNDTVAGSKFSLSASLALPPGRALPRLSWTITDLDIPRRRYFSIGFVGAPGLPNANTSLFAQPANCFSTETTNVRCPLNESVLLPDAAANLPYAMVANRLNTECVALVTDPSTFPFKPCEAWPNAPPTFSKTCPTNICNDGAKSDACNNRGWASEARSSLGIARGDMSLPLVFSPVFGGFGSQIASRPAHSHTFTVQLLVHQGTASETYRKLATEVYGFRDERDNSGTGSLNGAIERMADYLCDADGNNLLQWDAIQKYSFYWMDNACAFKPLDWMSGLSIALLTDDDRMYTKFAKEMAKFSLSHSDKEKYLWPYHMTLGLANLKDAKGHFGMAQNHGAGFASAAQIMQIHTLTGGRSSSLRLLAGMTDFNASLPCPNADHNYDTLLFYESTLGAERAHWWNCTVQVAEHLTHRDPKTPWPHSKYRCTDTDFFVSLFLITNETRYLEAAQVCGANCEVKYQVFPRATALDGEMVTVDAGNRSTSYWWSHGRWGSWGWPREERGMWSREQTVPTWRASHNGLVTSGGGGGGGWLGTLSLDSPVRMLRAATLSNDTYARALTKASLVGRFAHFPGDFQSKPKHTLLWEAPDLADHVLPQQTQTTWNTGHFWPIAGVTLDFLLTDVADRSNNLIRFPSQFVDSIPFGRLYSPALGFGRFYDDAKVYAWVPAGLFRSVSSTQFNWMAAYSEDAVYLALVSQSFVTESVTCVLNDALIGGSNISITDIWRNNAKAAPHTVTLNTTDKTPSFTIVDVPPKGIVALRLGGAVAKTRLQHRVIPSESSPPLSPNSRVYAAENGPFGIVSGMALSWGAGMTELYAFSQANSTMWAGLISKDTTATSHVFFDTVTLHWSVDRGTEQNLTGTIFPFDFSVPLLDTCKSVSFRFSGVSSNGTTKSTEAYHIQVAAIDLTAMDRLNHHRLKTDDSLRLPPMAWKYPGWLFLAHGRPLKPGPGSAPSGRRHTIGYPPLPWAGFPTYNMAQSTAAWFVGNDTGLNSAVEIAAQARFGVIGIGWQLNMFGSGFAHLEQWEALTARAIKRASPTTRVLVSRNTELGNGIWDSVRAQRSSASPQFWVRGQVNSTACRVGTLCSTPWWFSTDHAQCRRDDHVCSIPNGSQWFNWSHPPTQQWWLYQYTNQADTGEVDGVYFDGGAGMVGIAPQNKVAYVTNQQHTFDTHMSAFARQHKWTTAWWGERVYRDSCAQDMARLRDAYTDNDNETLQLIYGHGASSAPEMVRFVNFNQTLAAFLILRPLYALLAFDVLGPYECASAPCGVPSRVFPHAYGPYRRSPLLDVDFGVPTSKPVVKQPGIWSRNYSRAAIQLDCGRWDAKIVTHNL
jgi:hypothetical protein